MALKTRDAQAEHILITNTKDYLDAWLTKRLQDGWEVKWSQVIKVDPYDGMWTVDYILIRVRNE
jgi:hypothetical protein